MANPVHETTEGPERPISHQTFKAKLTQCVSYITGDMAAFGEWMKGTRVSYSSLDLNKEPTLFQLVNS